MDIVILLAALVGGLAGALSTFYLVVAMPVLFGWKVYRKIKYNISLFD